MKNKEKNLLAVLIMLSMSIAHAEVVVIVSTKSTVGNLDKEQISDLFLGKSSSYPDGSMAVPIDQNEGAIKEEFHDKVTEKSGSQLKSYWSKMVFSGKGNPPKEIPSNSEVIKLISANPSMIGYVEKNAADSSVKIVFKP